MFSNLLRAALVAAALLSHVHVAQGQVLSATNLPSQPSSSVYKNVLYISQSTELGQSASSPLQARFGPLTMSKNGYGLRTNLTDISSQARSNVVGLPRIALAEGVTTEAVLGAAKLWVQAYGASYLDQVAEFLRNRGIGIAYFSYYQAVTIQTAAGPKKKGVIWSGTVDLSRPETAGSGRAFYGDPRLVDGDPLFLDVQYYPLTTGSGVLAEEGYEHAGKILWRLLDKNLTALATPGATANGFVVVDVAGAYDNPADAEGDVGVVSCFIDKRHPGCTLTGVSATDAATLTTKAGASGVFAYYAESAQLEMVEQGSEYVPVLSISYDKRELTCTRLSEVMSVGKRLTLNGSLYYGAFNGNFYEYTVMDRLTRTQVIEPKAYSREALLADLSTIGFDPLKTLLSPFVSASLPSVYSLDNASQQETADFLSNVTYIANVEDKRQPTTYVGLLSDAMKDSPNAYIMEFPAQETTSSSGGGTCCATPVKLYGVDSGTTTVTASATSTTSTLVVDYELGIGNTTTPAPDNNVGGGDGTVFTRTFSFNVADKSKVPTFLLTYLGWDDHLQVLVNGKQVVHTENGNMLALANTSEGAACSGNWASVPVYGEPCLAWQSGGEGDSYCSQWSYLGQRQEWRPNPYAHMMTQVSTSAWVDVRWVDNCGESSCTSDLQLVNYSGCVFTERRSSPRQSANLDLSGYLVNGLNTITLKLAAGGGGEGWIRLRTSAVASGCS